MILDDACGERAEHHGGRHLAIWGEERGGLDGDILVDVVIADVRGGGVEAADAVGFVGGGAFVGFIAEGAIADEEGTGVPIAGLAEVIFDAVDASGEVWGDDREGIGGIVAGHIFDEIAVGGAWGAPPPGPAVAEAVIFLIEAGGIGVSGGVIGGEVVVGDLFASGDEAEIALETDGLVAGVADGGERAEGVGGFDASGLGGIPAGFVASMAGAFETGAGGGADFGIEEGFGGAWEGDSLFGEFEREALDDGFGAIVKLIVVGGGGDDHRDCAAEGEGILGVIADDEIGGGDHGIGGGGFGGGVIEFAKDFPADGAADFGVAAPGFADAPDIIDGRLFFDGRIFEFLEGEMRGSCGFFDGDFDVFESEAEVIGEGAEARHGAKVFGEEGELDFQAGSAIGGGEFVEAFANHHEAEFGDGGDATEAAGAVGHFDGDDLAESGLAGGGIAGEIGGGA